MAECGEILYVSAMCPQNIIDEIFNTCGTNPGFAMQKFNRLVATGIARNDIKVSTLSAIPVNSAHKKKFWGKKRIVCGDVTYNFLPFINVVGLRQICLTLGAFFGVLAFSMRHRNEKRIIMDVLNISVCIGARVAARLCGIKTCGIVTDMPGLLVGEDDYDKSIIGKTTTAVNKSYLQSFDSYVFLTKAMNKPINKRHKPHIVMEGVVDNNVAEYQSNRHPYTSSSKKTVVYAGGLHEKYGVKMLIEAFKKIDSTDAELHLFGDGPLVKAFSPKYLGESIIYHGVKPNKDIMTFEANATLLINPRPTTEKFTLYSFPSKNMEYMLSGTPVATTALPGMPDEYIPHVFILNDETVDGYATTLRELLALPSAQLTQRGISGQQFVLQNKNNIIQGHRIIELLNSI